jgi:hypothetical protein
VKQNLKIGELHYAKIVPPIDRAGVRCGHAWGTISGLTALQIDLRPEGHSVILVGPDPRRTKKVNKL